MTERVLKNIYSNYLIVAILVDIQKKQSLVAASTTEAECMVLFEAIKEALSFK